MKLRLTLLLLVLVCSTAARPADGLVSVNVRDADVLDVIRLLAVQSGNNVITQGPVKPGRISMYVRGVPFDRALRVVLQTHRLEAQRDGNILIIRNKASENEREGLKRSLHPAHRALPVRTLDRGVSTRTINTHFLRPSDLLRRLEVAVPDGSYVADDDADALIVTGTAQVQAKAKAAVAALDAGSRQVNFEVEIADIVPEANDSNMAVTNSHGYAVVRSSRDTEVWLKALMQRGRAQILAALHLVTLDNRRAELVMRQTCPEVFYDSKVGEQVEFVQFGVTLRMTPAIAREEGIRTEIHPEYSAVVGFSNGYPVFANRSIDATLRVESQQTIVFGGALSDIDAGVIAKFPALANDPVFGKVLRRRSRSHLKDVIVFLITPHVSAERAQSAAARNTGSGPVTGKVQTRVPVSHRR